MLNWYRKWGNKVGKHTRMVTQGALKELSEAAKKGEPVVVAETLVDYLGS